MTGAELFDQKPIRKGSQETKISDPPNSGPAPADAKESDPINGGFLSHIPTLRDVAGQNCLIYDCIYNYCNGKAPHNIENGCYLTLEKFSKMKINSMKNEKEDPYLATIPFLAYTQSYTGLNIEYIDRNVELKNSKELLTHFQEEYNYSSEETSL
jgi:hypothetical protein